MSASSESGMTPQDAVLPLPGCSTSLVTSISRSMPQNYSLGDIPTVIVAETGSVRAAADRGALPLHRLWDGLITSSNNIGALRNLATELQSRFSRSNLPELAMTAPEAWAKESYEIAMKLAYQNGAFRGTPKGKQRECRQVTDAALLPNGYAAVARKIADRRMMLAGYRLVDLLEQMSASSVP